MGCVGSIDQGTTGTRFALYDHEGRSLGYSYLEHRQIYPRPGWVEHDPLEIWQNVRKTIKDTMAFTKVRPTEIEAIGVTNQRETTVLWDLKGRPLCNAIVWQCRRTAPLVDMIKDDYGNDVREKTGLIPDPYFSATKIWWALDNIPKARRLASNGRLLFGNIDTWLIWNLTGSHITDYSNASRTMLYDIHKLRWDEELLEIMGGIPDSILPEVRSSSDPESYGSIDVACLGAVPVCGDVGDQQAALLGQGCFKPGDVKNTYGTGNFLLMNVGRRVRKSRHGLLSTIAYRITDHPVIYALEGSIFVTGAAVQWLRDGLNLIESSGETAQLAESVDNTGGVYFVPSFVGLGAPHWNMHARGTIVGLSRGTMRAHLVRAALEAECYQTKDVLDAMESDSGIYVDKIRVDGGGSTNDFMMQFQSNILGIPVIRPSVTETTSLGAAFAAGLASGTWESEEELSNLVGTARIFKPMMKKEVREELYRQWRSAVDCAMMWKGGVGE